jgi:hypothetical protein
VSPITGITTLGNILDCLPEEEGLVANTDALDAGEANVFLSRIQFERFESIADSGRFYESVTGVRGRFSDLHVDSIERDALQSAIEDHFIDFSVECYALVAGNVFIATSVMEANSIQYAFVVDRGYFLKTLPGDYPDVSDYAIFGAEVMTEKSENSPWISVAHSRVIAVDFQSVLELRTDNTSSPNLAEMVSRYERLHP